MPWSTLNWQASFRGVPFRLDAEELSGGRRYVDHRVAQRIFPQMEDLGRRDRAFAVRGFLTGDDSIEQRDRLLEACENHGSPGDLVHPLYGVLLCWCLDVRISTKQTELGIVQVQLTFAEASEQRLIIRRETGAESADAAAAALDQAAIDAAATGLQVEGQPQGVLDQASEVMRKAGNALLELDVLAGPELEVAQLATQARLLVSTASQLVTSPANFAQTLANALGDVLGAVGDAPRQGVEAYRELAALAGPNPLGGPGVASAAAAANAELTLGLVKAVAIGGMVRAAARVSWGWYEEALEVRDEIAALLDELADSGQGGDESYLAAQGLRAALFASVPPEGANLPHLGSVQLDAATPSLVLAYRLYGDTERAEEIQLRNHARRPGFLPSGVELEVLTGA